jgi:chloramphenicol-sensitive protein RarD
MRATPDPTAAPGERDLPLPGRNSRPGLFYGLGAYIIWGFIPIYFHALAGVSPWIVLCHRIFWSAIFLAAVVSARGEWRLLRPVLASRRQLLFLSAGALLIAANWLIFIYAVATRQLLQASLGYFINPLLSIALGMIFLGERLRPRQWAAVVIAGAAVANLALRANQFPWIALSAAGTFGFYGLVRKKLDIHSLHGLLVETAILFPVALVFLALPTPGQRSPAMLGLLSLSGILTAVPLLMFGAALRRLKLSTVGFLQYIGPTLQFLVALVLFREPLDHAKLASFALSWLAIAVYVADSLLARLPPAVADEPE